jgi:transcriptional regulator with XRE-family HTH domain
MAYVIGCDPGNNATLRKIRTDLHLSRLVIAEIAGVSKSLVDSWLVSPHSKNFRPMPKKSLRLIQLELGLEPPAYVAVRLAAEERAAAIKGA